MKKGLKTLLLGTAAALWMAAPAAAEIKLHGVTWQFAKPGPRLRRGSTRAPGIGESNPIDG